VPDRTPLSEVLVSLQAAGPEPNHIAAGLLGDRDMVLVPAPPLTLLDPTREFDVVTIPVPLDSGYPVERLRATCAQVMWVAGDRTRPIGVMLKLRLPSQYSNTMAPFNGALLAAQLDANGGDLWSALEALGTVREGLREGPPPDILAALPEAERSQREVTYRDHDHATPADIGFSLCRWLCICQPR
jgi:hypothetical protein